MQRKWILPVLTLVLIVVMAGCSRSVVPTPSPTHAPTPTAMTTPMTSPMTTPGISPETSPLTSPEASAEPGSIANAGDTAKNVATEVDKLSEIDSSAVAISGNTALIAVQFDKQYMGELTTRIKDMVADKAKAVDSQITRVVVTADPDLFTRIKQMFDDLIAGNGADIGTEFEEIINRAAPTT